MGDAFYRWDGFSYYASVSEFLPSVALAFILWSFVALLLSITLWLILMLFHWLCRLFNWEIGPDHLLLFTVIFILAAVLAWKGKKILWPDAQTTVQVKLIVFFGVALVSIFVTYLLHNKAGQLMVGIHERITPLVWLFGIIAVLSVPIISYHAWFKKADGADVKAIAGASLEDLNRPNIILVTFDALAANNMSAFGYARETTPFISRWSQNATLFTKAEADSNFTAPAVASLMTGKRVWTHQTYHIGGTRPVRSHIESLPSLMKENNYFNIALVVNPFASVESMGMSESFDIAPPASEFGKSASLFGWKFGIIDNIIYRAVGEKIKLYNWILKDEFIFGKFLNLVSRNIYQTTVPPEKVFNRFLEIVDGGLHKPFFAWIHVFPPHDPYLPPEDFIKIYNASTELRSYKPQEKLIQESYEYLFENLRYPQEIQPAVDLMRDYYDEFIKYSDRKFEDFINALTAKQLENTVIILSADHGESFEKGYFTHAGPFLYEQVTNIPLIIKDPGQQKGLTITDRVEQIDIPATILDLANIPVPAWMEGVSLLPLMRGSQAYDRPVYSMNFQGNRSMGHKITKGSIAVWEGDYKLIYYLEKDEAMLFNLKTDPGESYNIFEKEPGKYNYMLSLIKESLEKVNGKMRK